MCKRLVELTIMAVTVWAVKVVTWLDFSSGNGYNTVNEDAMS